MSPYYFNHEMAVTMAGCRPVLVATDDDFQLDLDAVAAAITANTRAVVTISPNNPSGAVYPEADLRELNRLCAERGVYHIHDEAYEYFLYDGAEHFSPGSLPDAGDHTISLFSLSKAYGFASWRIGYLPPPRAPARRGCQDPGHDRDLPGGHLAVRGVRGAGCRRRLLPRLSWRDRHPGDQRSCRRSGGWDRWLRPPPPAARSTYWRDWRPTPIRWRSPQG